MERSCVPGTKMEMEEEEGSVWRIRTSTVRDANMSWVRGNGCGDNSSSVWRGYR